MKYYINLVAPKKSNRISLAEYKRINKKGFDKLMTALINAMVKHEYTK